jgi:hypothetical protein
VLIWDWLSGLQKCYPWEGDCSVLGFDAKSWLRGTLGAALAYVLAIQLILTAALSTQMVIVASGDLQAICHSTGTSSPADNQDNPAQSDDHHKACRICAFATCTPSLSGTYAVLLVWPYWIAAPRVAARTSYFALERHEPRSSQGPPAVV